MDSISYSSGIASRNQVTQHLRDVDSQFHPPLSSRVDLEQYGHRLYSQAKRVEAWSAGGRLVGLLAYYMDRDSHRSFVSNLSVSASVRRWGVGSALLVRGMERMKAGDSRRVYLETTLEDQRAMGFYMSHGFEIESRGERVLLVCEIAKT